MVSLGLRHDGVSNTCNATGYIMAAGRGLRGATTWSTCAKEKIRLQKYVGERDESLISFSSTLQEECWEIREYCREKKRKRNNEIVGQV